MSHRNTLVEAISRNGNVPEPVASDVLDYYLSLKVATVNAHDGYRIKHGAFLDAETITLAVTQLPR